ncbi:MAG: sulfotransferase family protein [Candidatus Puniceispirillales bacterium]
MKLILALWAVPRSTSTAFEWMMRQRGDLDCLHEPFGEAWYQGEDPLWPRLQADSLRTPGLTLDSVWDDLRARAAKGAVFIKDFPHYIDHIWTPAMLGHFTHSFLIRDPAKTITSMHSKWPDFHEKEVGFAEQRALFDLITEIEGTPPPVIDSDDLLEDPVRMVRLWCEAVGIPFIEEALSWEPGARDEVSWWDGGSFHANLRNSDGLKPQPRGAYPDITETPPRVQEIHARARQHYDHLYPHRLR